MGTRLYVGNLAYTTMEDDLRALFTGVGVVVGCDLVIDRFTSKSRGFAFVEMTSPEDAGRAVEQLNGYELDGRKLMVNEARPREPRDNVRGEQSRPVGRRKSGKGSRRGARAAKRQSKGFF
jgi:RNA recognition motif-containing protein